jgi:hypothetical protein
MIIVVVLSSTAAMQNMLTAGLRQREADTIWRGNQIVRAIRFYYHATGHYPASLDDLQAGIGAADIHVLRAAAYKNPMNPTDGTWRFIYTNAGGQIIGSVRYATLAQMALMDQNGGQLPVSAPGSQIGTPVSSLASGFTEQSGQTPTGGQTTAGGQTATGGQAPVATLLQPTGPVQGTILGGFLSGVAGTVDKPSINVYKGGKTYLAWEFIWNPIEDQVAALQQGLSPGQLNLPGQPGIGTPPTGNNGIGAGGIGAPGGIGGTGVGGTPPSIPNTIQP